MVKKQASLHIFKAVLLGVIILTTLYFVSRDNYPLFHSIADTVTVFIAASVFVIVWNARHRLDNHYYLYVGIAFLSFAFLDFMHLLGNQDMGVFPEYGNLGPTLYIASRYVLGISLLIAPLFIKRKLNTTMALTGYGLVTLLILLSVFYWRNFPVTFIQGVGLTAFKVISDYLICIFLAGAIGLLLVNRRAFDGRVLKLLIYSLILSIATGLAFTLYTDPFGITNAVGHFFQIASFYLVFLAFVETALTKPQDILYRNLTQTKEEVIKLNTELEKVNVDLQQDILKRQKVEEQLNLHRGHLEDLVEERTNELREATRRLFQVQENERREIAKELHDQTGQYLTALSILLGSAQKRADGKVLDAINEAYSLVGELVQQVRSMSLNLRPSMLDDMGLLHTLIWHFDNYKKQTGIEVIFQHNQINGKFTPEINTTAYRIIQEALTNVAKYADVKRVVVNVSVNGQMEILIKDEGKGFVLGEGLTKASNGLSGMRERALLVGGKVTIDSSPGKGTIVKALLPLSQSSYKLQKQSI